MANLKLADGQVVFDPGWQAELLDQVKPLMEQIGEVAEQAATQIAPRWTGEVARSVDHEVEDDGSLWLYATDWRAPFVEYGAGGRGEATSGVSGWPQGIPVTYSGTPYARPASPFLRPGMLAAIRRVVG